MEIIKKGPLEIAGIKVTADWEKLHIEMPKAWKRFIGQLEHIADRKSDIMMDVSLEKSGHFYTQMICVEVKQNHNLPEGMAAIHIPARKYLYYQHHGTVYDIAASFGKMYDWAKSNGYKTGDFKLDQGYLADGSEDTHDLYIQIFV